MKSNYGKPIKVFPDSTGFFPLDVELSVDGMSLLLTPAKARRLAIKLLETASAVDVLNGGVE